MDLKFSNYLGVHAVSSCALVSLPPRFFLSLSEEISLQVPLIRHIIVTGRGWGRWF